MAASDADRLPENEVIAQMAYVETRLLLHSCSDLRCVNFSGLVLGATDTTSNTLARILEQLAIHPEVQQELRDELLSSGAAEGMSYDDLNRLPLLEGVCRETIRL